MKTVLALDPGFRGTRTGIWDVTGHEIQTGFVPAGRDPFEAAQASLGIPPSIVVVPGGPPGAPWHPFSQTAEAARAYCSSADVPLIEVSPMCSADLPPEARLSGHGKWQRQGFFYAVPQRAAFEAAARTLGIPRDSARVVTIYLGDEVAVSAHDGDRVVDTSDPVTCEGPFGLTSAGTAPATAFVAWVGAAKRPEEDIRTELKARSGAYAYAGVQDIDSLREALGRGERGALTAIAGMAYQVSKEAGRQIAALRGQVDAVALCGPGTSLDALVCGIEARLSKWCRVLSIRDDLTMLSLVREGIRVLSSKL